MSVRITQSMLYSRALQDIRKGSLGLVRLQEQVSSGRLVNRPSDDPARALRILPLNNELRDLAGLKDNVGLARETMDLAAASLEEASSTMSRLRELLLQASNDTVNDRDRNTIAVEVNELLGQMLTTANTKKDTNYLFGGMRTDTPPFRLVTTASGTRVEYDGDQDTHLVEVAPGTRMALYAPGDAIFTRRNRGATVFAGDTGAASSGGTDTGVGLGKLQVTFAGLNTPSLPTGISASADTPNTTAVGTLTYNVSAGQMSIDGGPPVPIPATNQAFQTGDTPPRTIHLTVGATVTPANGTFTANANLSTDGGATTTTVDFTSGAMQVRNSHDGSILNVDVSNMNRIGTEELRFSGTFDPFTLMISVRDVLQNADGLSREEVGDKLRLLLEDVKSAHDDILEATQTKGYRSQSLDMLEDRIDTLTLSSKETLSNIQDTDLSQAIFELTQKQFNFQAALQVGARVVQTSLLDFLR